MSISKISFKEFLGARIPNVKIFSSKVDEIIDEVNSLKPRYKKYLVVLNQTGTDAPEATVLENTLGEDVVWSYDGVGSYLGTVTGDIFTNHKTFFLFSAKYTNISSGNQVVEYAGIYNSVNDFYIMTAQVETATGAYTAANGWLVDTLLEIRVYE